MKGKQERLKTDSKRAYEVWHDELSTDSNANSPWHNLIKMYLQPRDLADKSILEIGCGRGGFACWLASQPQQPRRVIAADFAATAIKKAKAFADEHKISGITWEVNDVESISHPDESFDTVISCETIEHVAEPRKALSELARVLKPGGRLFLTTPNYLGSYGLYRIYLRLRGRVFTEEGQPINNFMLLPLTRAWVVRAGLRVKTIDAVGHYIFVPGRVPIEMPFLNNPRLLMRWLGLHSLLIAEKP